MLGESRAAWTEGASLPGGDFTAWIGQPLRPDADFERFVVAVRSRHPWLDAVLARRLARAYGSRIAHVLGDANSRADLGEEVAPGLFAIELGYLRREEWACTADDVLWRRTKRGLHFSEAQRQCVADWMNQAEVNFNKGAMPPCPPGGLSPQGGSRPSGRPPGGLPSGRPSGGLPSGRKSPELEDAVIESVTQSVRSRHV
jgi:glycerol-3-phosphate dehydrogenase